MAVPAAQQRLIDALLATGRFALVETHISWLLLDNTHVYKIKKALDLGFLDHTTLAARQHACDEELRLNRRIAPALYQAVLPIGGTPEQPVLGAQPAIEYAVRMQRFPGGQLFDELLARDALLPQHIDALAQRVALFHAGLPRAAADGPYGTPPAIHHAAWQNFAQLRELLPPSDEMELAALEKEMAAEYARCEPVFAQRMAQGWVRECHGDLHLGNVTLLDDAPLPFDAIEFAPALRWIDVIDEVAFTMMDLLYHGRRDYAWRYLNAWLEASGDYAGVRVLRFYLAYRAMVRAKVAAIRAAQQHGAARDAGWQTCRDYLRLAASCLSRPRPVLIITHGLPGSGKTTCAQYLIEQLGAVRIRSDVERKRLHGLETLASSQAAGVDLYGAQATQLTYARLHELSALLLQAGCTVVVDAAFLQRAERADFRRLAQASGVPFVIATLSASTPTLLARLRQRRGDASEADARVLAKLQAVQQPLSVRERAIALRFNTAQPPQSASNARSWRRLLKYFQPL
ncbi:MAG: AAA family ATPase [Pseudomonadota bacterium]